MGLGATGWFLRGEDALITQDERNYACWETCPAFRPHTVSSQRADISRITHCTTTSVQRKCVTNELNRSKEMRLLLLCSLLGVFLFPVSDWCHDEKIETSHQKSSTDGTMDNVEK